MRRRPTCGCRRQVQEGGVSEDSRKALVIVLLLVVHFREAYVEHNRRLPALYGIWDVEEFARDGVPVSPGDRARWHRLVVAERGAAAIQWTAGGLVNPYNMSDDPVNGVLTRLPSEARARL